MLAFNGGPRRFRPQEGASVTGARGRLRRVAFHRAPARGRFRFCSVPAKREQDSTGKDVHFTVRAHPALSSAARPHSGPEQRTLGAPSHRGALSSAAGFLDPVSRSPHTPASDRTKVAGETGKHILERGWDLGVLPTHMQIGPVPGPSSACAPGCTLGPPGDGRANGNSQ